MQNSTICISHSEDADGLICASFMVRLKGASIILVSYDDLEKTIKRINPPLDELYICDVNIREELFERVRRIADFAKVTIADHHPTARDVLASLGEVGVEVLYDPSECASILLFNHFREELGREGARLAAYAAISDQFEDGPISSKVLTMFDRHFVQQESLMLTHALSWRTTRGFRRSVIDELSVYTFPHRIRGVSRAAFEELESMSKLIESLPVRSTRIGRLAYVEFVEDSSLGTIAGLILDAIDVDIGVSFRRVGKGLANVSVRARRGLRPHMGEVTKELAAKYGGFGGGHSRASGASIPESSLEGFINGLVGELEKRGQP